MARDFTLPVRKATLSLLKSDAALTARVPAGSIYPQSPIAQPAWPFIRYGAPITSPLRLSCVDSSEVDFAVHVFSKGTSAKSAEDDAAEISALVASALDRTVLLPGGGSLRLTWRGSELMRDRDEAGAYHGIVSVRARVLA